MRRACDASRKSRLKVKGIEFKLTLLVEDDDGGVNEASGQSDWDQLLNKRKSKP